MHRRRAPNSLPGGLFPLFRHLLERRRPMYPRRHRDQPHHNLWKSPRLQTITRSSIPTNVRNLGRILRFDTSHRLPGPADFSPALRSREGIYSATESEWICCDRVLSTSEAGYEADGACNDLIAGH